MNPNEVGRVERRGRRCKVMAKVVEEEKERSEERERGVWISQRAEHRGEDAN